MTFHSVGEDSLLYLCSVFEQLLNNLKMLRELSFGDNRFTKVISNSHNYQKRLGLVVMYCPEQSHRRRSVSPRL
jgi:hypothetical protein